MVAVMLATCLWSLTTASSNTNHPQSKQTRVWKYQTLKFMETRLTKNMIRMSEAP